MQSCNLYTFPKSPRALPLSLSLARSLAQKKMEFLSLSTFFFLTTLLLFFFLQPTFSDTNPTPLSLLMRIKSSLDPRNAVLSSWSETATDPCDGGFEGIACDDGGRVVNISLQGKGLSGQIPPEIGLLTSLSGLYLHFNELRGVVPKELANLTELSDLYLNVNNLYGNIPPQIGHLTKLQVMQLCCNKFTGSIPTQLGSLKKLDILALQSNELIGAIPASLGELQMLTRLDLSFNKLFGSIPSNLAALPMLKTLDVQNNTLSGKVPIAFKKLDQGFKYANNEGLCGVSFASLKMCTNSGQSSNKPDPVMPSIAVLPPKYIPESVNISESGAPKPKKPKPALLAVGVSLPIISLLVLGLFTFSRYRLRKQKITSALNQVREVCRRSASPLISVEYSTRWDPLSKVRDINGILDSYVFNLDEVECATHHFSETNLLGKNSFSAVYKGVLRDGSVVAITCISKISCRSNEAEFLDGLKLLAEFKHDNLLRLRGFCCSKGRGEWYLIYDYVTNGSLMEYLDVEEGEGRVLDWDTRVSIIKGIAKGIEFMHGSKKNKPTLIHRTMSAGKVLLDHHYNPLLSDAGLHKLLADEVVFSTLKSSAAMGYLPPEYTTTGQFSEKSDVYAFGIIMLQILSGRSQVMHLSSHEFIDVNLDGKYEEVEAARLHELARLCTHVSPSCRPDMEMVLQSMDDSRSSL